MYVAATRARNLLIISTYPAKKSLSPWAELEPFMDGADELEEIGVKDAPLDRAVPQERQLVEPDGADISTEKRVHPAPATAEGLNRRARF